MVVKNRLKMLKFGVKHPLNVVCSFKKNDKGAKCVMFQVEQPVILASSSPRRRELLALLIKDFAVIGSGADESVDFPCTVSQMVETIAQRKAQDVAKSIESSAWVIGADTVVALGHAVLGKPVDLGDARRMLMMLQGNTHTVYTGVCLKDCSSGKIIVRNEATEVTFAPMDHNEIEDYLASGESMDKAGAYGIQGFCSRYITGIKGCFYNVMGLPVRMLYEMMKEMQLMILI